MMYSVNLRIEVKLLDIYTAKNAVEKLLNYVQSIAGSRPQLYSKSKDKYREIALMCEQVVHIISDILQENVLGNDVEEFQPTSAKLYDTVTNMQSELNRLSQFISYSPELSAIHSESSAKITSEERRNVVKKYKTVISSLSESNISNRYASDCAKLMWKWLDTRFFRANKNFKYNIRRLAQWVPNIVIAFGKSISEGNCDKFTSDFSQWCESLYSVSDNHFAVPYNIYQLDKEVVPGDIPLTSVVLWDILLDSGLSDLCSHDNSLYPSEDILYRRCSILNPYELDMYKHYKVDPNVLSICRLVDAGDDI